LKNGNVQGLEVGNVKLSNMASTFISIQNELASIHNVSLTNTRILVDDDFT